MEFNRNLKKAEKEKYIEICSSIWGCVPIDIDWAIGTNSYKESLKKIDLISKHKTKIKEK